MRQIPNTFLSRCHFHYPNILGVIKLQFIITFLCIPKQLAVKGATVACFQIMYISKFLHNDREQENSFNAGKMDGCQMLKQRKVRC